MEIKKCTNFKDRFMGLMFQKNIKEGLCFPKCNSIHTFFMKEDIDVVMTDIDKNILFEFKKLKPGKIITPKENVYYTYEFPSGTIEKLDINGIIKEDD